MESLTLHTHPPNFSCLKQVIVRLILPCERERWAALMRQYHYLGFVGMMGQSLRYVAECSDQWLALLGWQSAALKCKSRDQWIGWAPVLQYGYSGNLMGRRKRVLF